MMLWLLLAQPNLITNLTGKRSFNKAGPPPDRKVEGTISVIGVGM